MCKKKKRTRYDALYGNVSGSANVAIGYTALQVSTGSQNTAIGYTALRDISSGTGNTGVGNFVGLRDVTQSDFQTLGTINNSTLLGQSAQATCSNCLILGGQGANAVSVGLGTPNPTNFLSVQPKQYNTGTVATTSGSGAVVGTGTTFTSAMVGSEIYIASNSNSTATYKGTVSAFTDTTHITVTGNVGFTLASAHFYILYSGLQVKSDGTVYTQGSSTTQFQVQNMSGTALLTADTTNMVVTVTALTVTGNLTVNGHVITGGATPTIAAGAAACTSPTVSIAGNDTTGTITVTTGTGCTTGGKLATVTFNTAFGAAPRVNLTPANSNSTAFLVYIDGGTISTTAFDVDTASSAVIGNSTTYEWYYDVKQ